MENSPGNIFAELFSSRAEDHSKPAFTFAAERTKGLYVTRDVTFTSNIVSGDLPIMRESVNVLCAASASNSRRILIERNHRAVRAGG
jgi:hypothetical protein